MLFLRKFKSKLSYYRNVCQVLSFHIYNLHGHEIISFSLFHPLKYVLQRLDCSLDRNKVLGYTSIVVKLVNMHHFSDIKYEKVSFK